MLLPLLLGRILHLLQYPHRLQALARNSLSNEPEEGSEVQHHRNLRSPRGKPMIFSLFSLVTSMLTLLSCPLHQYRLVSEVVQPPPPPPRHARTPAPFNSVRVGVPLKLRREALAAPHPTQTHHATTADSRTRRDSPHHRLCIYKETANEKKSRENQQTPGHVDTSPRHEDKRRTQPGLFAA